MSIYDILDFGLNQRHTQGILSHPMAREVHSILSLVRSWHPHIYEQPIKQPTPHLISNILGFKENECKRRDEIRVPDFRALEKERYRRRSPETDGYISSSEGSDRRCSNTPESKCQYNTNN